MACVTCRHLKRTCSWLIGNRANYPDGECDWDPSRYVPIQSSAAPIGAEPPDPPTDAHLTPEKQTA